MPRQVNREFALLAACCIWPPSPRREDAIAEAAAGTIDWARFLRVARRHRVSGLVRHGLARAGIGMPAEVGHALKADAGRMARDGLALCHRRGILPLHASAVALAANGAAAFVGRSGAGKSTMLAALAQRRHTVLTDDVCFMRVGPRGEALVWPGISLIRLWRDAIEALALDADGAERVGRRIDKFEIYPRQETARPEPRRLRRLFVLSAADRPEEEGISPLEGAKGLDAVWQNIYRPALAQRLGRQAEVFAAAGRIAADIEVFAFRRMRDFARLDATVARIEAHLLTSPD